MLYFLRHGELDGDADLRFIGQLDLPLSARGRGQAAAWRDHFLSAGIEFARICSSDLERCRETARIIAPAREVLFARDLREIHLGEWEGRLRAEMRKERPELWERRGKEAGLRPEGGESWIDLERRSVQAIGSMAAPDPREDTLFITHSGVIRSYICNLLEIPWKNRFMIRLDYSGLSVVDTGSVPAAIARLNLVLE
jgi:broad specificity phosphatase PhoE